MKLLDIFLAVLIFVGTLLGFYSSQSISINLFPYAALTIAMVACSIFSAKKIFNSIEYRALQSNAFRLSSEKFRESVAETSLLLTLHVPYTEPTVITGRIENRRHLNQEISKVLARYLLGTSILAISFLWVLALEPQASTRSGLFGSLMKSNIGVSLVHGIAVYLSCWSFSYFLLNKVTIFERAEK